jgi:hypothetical protein
MKIKSNETEEKLLDYMTALGNSLLIWRVVTDHSVRRLSYEMDDLGFDVGRGPGIYLFIKITVYYRYNLLHNLLYRIKL